MPSIYLASLAGTNVFLSFVFLWLVVTSVGSNGDSDAFFLGFTLVQTLISIVTACILNVVTPILVPQGEPIRQKTAGVLFMACLAIIGPISLLLYLFSYPLVRILAPGLDHSSAELAGELLRLMCAAVVVQSCTQVLIAKLYAQKSFVMTETFTLISNGVSVLALFILLPDNGVIAAGWAVLLKHISQSILMLVGARIAIVREIDWELLKLVWSKSRYLLMAGLYSKTDKVIDKFFASMMAPGAITLLHLGQQIYGAGHQVLNRGIVNPAIPELVATKNSFEWSEFKSIVKSRTILLLILGCAGYGVVLLGGQNLLTLSFGYGQITSDSVEILWLLMVLCVGYGIMPPIGFALASMFYSLGNTHTPTRVAMISTTAGIVAKVALFYVWGIYGLAVGISIHYFLAALLLLVFARKKLQLMS